MSRVIAATGPGQPAASPAVEIPMTPSQRLQFRPVSGIASDVLKEQAKASSWMDEMGQRIKNDALEGRAHTVRVMRVNQLDAQMLDGELLNMLLYQFKNIFQYTGLGVLAHLKPELDAGMRLLLFWFTVLRDKPSAGNKLQDLCLKTSSPILLGPALTSLRSTLSSLLSPTLLLTRTLAAVAKARRVYHAVFFAPLLDPSAVVRSAMVNVEGKNGNLVVSVVENILGTFLARCRTIVARAVLLYRDYRRQRAVIPVVSQLDCSGPVTSSPALFNLSGTQKFLYAALTIGGVWGWTRFKEYRLEHMWGAQPEDTWQHVVNEWCGRLELWWRVCSVANFLLFLQNGQHSSLVGRLLRVRLVYIHSRVSRQVAFDFMNQQLVWQGFSDFMLFVLPLIDFTNIRTMLQRILSFGSESGPTIGCPVCQADTVITPYQATCGHIYCYYCLRASLMAPNRFQCPASGCGRPVTSMRPVVQTRPAEQRRVSE